MSSEISVTAVLVDEMSGNIKKIRETIDNEFRKVQQTTEKTSGKMGEFKNAILGLSPVALSVTGVVVGVGAAFKFALGQAFEAEARTKQLNAVLRSTGEIAGVTRGMLERYTEALAKETAFSKDDIEASQIVLLRFTNLGKDVFPLAMRAAADMAAVTGDLAGANQELGRILNDPILGMSLLHRQGIQLSKSQEDAIKKYTETNNVFGAQKIILEKLSEVYGGAATAQLNTYQGAMKRLKNTISEIGEGFGKNWLYMFEYITKGEVAARIGVTNYEGLLVRARIIKKEIAETKIDPPKTGLLDAMLGTGESANKAKHLEDLKAELAKIEEITKAHNAQELLDKAAHDAAIQKQAEDAALVKKEADQKRADQLKIDKEKETEELNKKRIRQEAIDKAEKEAAARDAIHRLKVIEAEKKAKNEAAESDEINRLKQIKYEQAVGQGVANTIGSFGQLNQALKGNAEITKAMAITQTIINTAVAVTKAMSQTGVLSPVVIPGIIAEGLAQTAIIASQKFAQGGIVGGNSYYGDNVNARVNSEEMILTKAQQSRLFSMANGGGGDTNLKLSINLAPGSNFDMLAADKVVDVLTELGRDGKLVNLKRYLN